MSGFFFFAKKVTFQFIQIFNESNLMTFYFFLLLDLSLQDELFERAKSEMLDEVMSLNEIKPKQWSVEILLSSGQ